VQGSRIWSSHLMQKKLKGRAFFKFFVDLILVRLGNTILSLEILATINFEIKCVEVSISLN
jgi:hypothetical protein